MRISSLIAGVAALSLFSFARVHSAGSAPFEFRDGLIRVEAEIAGYGPAKFLVDSGAGATLIDRRIAQKLGLATGRTQRVQGVNGTVPAQWVNGIEATVAGVPLPNSTLAMDLQGVAGSTTPIDGILGIDFFEGRAVQIDFDRRTLRVLSPSERGAVQGEKLALSRRNGCYCARASIDGTEGQWLRVDTGCDSSLEWVSDAGKPWGKRFEGAVKLGGVTVADVPVKTHGKPFFTGERGLIGNGLLAKFCITLDMTRKQLVLARR